MSENDKGAVTPLRGKRVVLGVCGSIAAYKGADVCRRLVKSGAEVQVVMTTAGTRFVAPLTFQALTGRPVATEVFPASHAVVDDGMQHIALGREADLVLVAPATADLIARAAAGRADDLLACVLLVTLAPVLIAPAMNPAMWAHPMTQANVERLHSQAEHRFIGPAAGETACGEEGPGRMVEPEAIVLAATQTLLGLAET